ncbi:hypothetical protein [Maribellus mangrovi]|uniref:hypothetical protein n=1 Tax=Maribellus mangrovi TaxID=3133146 RepID=UPI0030ED197A
MKTVIFSLLFFLSAFLGTNLSAQNYVMELNAFIEYNNINLTNSRSGSTYEDVQGTPFLYGDFAVGRVKLNNQKYYEGELRYNNYKQQLEFKNEKGEVYDVLTPENISSVKLKDVTLVYEDIDGSGGFYRQLVPGAYMLLAKDKAEYQEPKPARPYVEAKPARFVTKNPEYFLYNAASGLVELKNKKSLDGIYPEKSKEIQAFVKKEKIKFSDEEDLSNLVKFLNTL